MDNHVEKRRLAAVMFADIEGYTALFQKDESTAFDVLGQHRKDLKETAEKHKGHIVKYYGDGSLTLFNSVIEATKCAVDLQQASTQHQISLRIGLHMGEMIEKDKDVYGDAVNVASRIQAIGIPGSILVSKTVEDELKNHPNLTLKTLGYVKLKNVKNAVEVFAITNSGLTVPHSLPGAVKINIKRFAFVVIPLIILALAALFLKNKIISSFTRIGDECIIIPPFISHVPNKELDFFSTLASSELIKAMSESAKANIIPYTTMLLYTNSNIGSFINNPALAKRLGADIEVRGEYTLEGDHLDTLRISLSILDLKNDRLLQTPIPYIKCAAADKRECLEEAKNQLVGYWKSKRDYLFQITTDSAYINYHIAQNMWAEPEKKDEVKSYLLKAIQHDPKFLDAWFLLLDLFQNEKEYRSGMDTLKVMESRFTDLDQRQQGYLRYYKSDFEGNNVQAFASFLKEYRQNKNDLFVNTTGMAMALEYLNDPLVTLQIYNQIDPGHLDLSSCIYCYTRFSLAMKAYLEISNMEKAGQLAKQTRPFATKTSHFISLLKYYVATNDTLSINDVIRMAARKSDEPDEAEYLYFISARMAALKGYPDLRNQYASKAIQLYTKRPNLNLARCYLLQGNLKEAKRLFIENLMDEHTDRNTFAYLGIIYAREGDKKSAEQMIEKLNKIRKDYDFGYTPYVQGRIKAHLGEIEAAVNYFKIALEEGIRFLPTTTFLNDPDMIIMNSNKAYLSLLASNRLNTIE